MEKQELERLLKNKFGKDFIEKIKELDDVSDGRYTDTELYILKENVAWNMTHIQTDSDDVVRKYNELYGKNAGNFIYGHRCILRRALCEIYNALDINEGWKVYPSAIKSRFKKSKFARVEDATKEGITVVAMNETLKIEIPAEYLLIHIKNN